MSSTLMPTPPTDTLNTQITDAQREALEALHWHDANGAASFEAFACRVRQAEPFGPIKLEWGGETVVVQPDGYTHT